MNSKAALVVALPVLAAGAWILWPGSHAAPGPAKQQAVAKAEAPAPPAPEPTPVENTQLALALERKAIVAEFNGNGREKLRVVALNKGTAPLQLSVPLGQIFDSETASPVIVVESASMLIQPGKTRELDLRTAATRSTGAVGPASFKLSYNALPKLEPLLLKVQEHPQLTQGALQTAILAVTENLPVSAVAKFSQATTALPSRFNTDPFRVETYELVEALTLLRETGVRETGIALTIDPQLRIEAMIDPNARPVAMRYYGIAPEGEWEFWRQELLQGEPSTRHYALYGIARFYPEVALQMLPRWARETRTNPVYRLSAVQALADTQRPEALPILRDLALELGQSSELAKAARGAAEYLDYQLAQLSAARNAVAFRTRKTTGNLAARDCVKADRRV